MGVPASSAHTLSSTAVFDAGGGGFGELRPSGLLKLDVLLRLLLAPRPSGDLVSTGRTLAGRVGRPVVEDKGERLGLGLAEC